MIFGDPVVGPADPALSISHPKRRLKYHFRSYVRTQCPYVVYKGLGLLLSSIPSHILSSSPPLLSFSSSVLIARPPDYDHLGRPHTEVRTVSVPQLPANRCSQCPMRLADHHTGYAPTRRLAAPTTRRRVRNGKDPHYGCTNTDSGAPAGGRRGRRGSGVVPTW